MQTAIVSLGEAFRRVRARRGELVRELRRCLAGKRLVSHASAISYQLLFALLPLALATLALCGFLGLEEVWNGELRQQARDHLSSTAFRLVDGTVAQVMSSKRALWLTAGAAFALWKLSSAARVTMDALDELYGLERSRAFGRRLAVSLGLALVTAACLVAAALVVVLGGRAARGDVMDALSFVLRWGVAIGLMLVAVVFLLRFAPARRQPLQWVSFGSLLVVATWVLTSVAFGFYTERLARWESLFGGLATAIVLMLYLYVSAIAFLVGAQVDVLIRAEASASGPVPAPRADQELPPGPRPAAGRPAREA